MPARSGSKGIPCKNIAKINGIPLVGLVGNVVKEIDCIDYAILSTDSSDIANLGKAYDLQVPFLRPKSLSEDDSLSVDVWHHAWLEAEKITGKIFDISLFLEPTSPLRKAKDLYAAMDKLILEDASSVITVSISSAHSTPEKTILVDEHGLLGLYINNGTDFSIRQKIPNYYHRNGICYAAKRETIIRDKVIITPKTFALVIERVVVNIDEPIDLIFAEFLLSRSNE